MGSSWAQLRCGTRSRLARDADRHRYEAWQGWRDYWREDGKRRATATYERKGEARAALNREFDRMRLGDAYRPPILFRELAERFLAHSPIGGT
jgi:hypothetical protein